MPSWKPENKAPKRIWVFVAAMIAALAGCTTANKKYCDEDTPCAKPSLNHCEYNICVPTVRLPPNANVMTGAASVKGPTYSLSIQVGGTTLSRPVSTTDTVVDPQVFDAPNSKVPPENK